MFPHERYDSIFTFYSNNGKNICDIGSKSDELQSTLVSIIPAGQKFKLHDAVS